MWYNTTCRLSILSVLLIFCYTRHFECVYLIMMTSSNGYIFRVTGPLCRADQRQHQSSASLAFVRGIHRWPMDSPHKGPVTGKMFPFDDVIMVKQIFLYFAFGHNIGCQFSLTIFSYLFIMVTRGNVWETGVRGVLRNTIMRDGLVSCDPTPLIVRYCDFLAYIDINLGHAAFSENAYLQFYSFLNTNVGQVVEIILCWKQYQSSQHKMIKMSNPIGLHIHVLAVLPYVEQSTL